MGKTRNYLTLDGWKEDSSETGIDFRKNGNTLKNPLLMDWLVYL